MATLKRNRPCWCGSGRKYKRCHYPYGPDQVTPQSSTHGIEESRRLFEIRERLRKAQQGEGRPLISTRIANHQVVATGNTLHYSPSWVTFADFLFDYIAQVLGREWGSAELEKAEKDRHTIATWYQHCCEFQRKKSKDRSGLYSAEMDGGVICYLGLAYSLYLIKHNATLQSRLVNRLKNHTQFQGAYYELIVANSLIRAGFELILEDEGDFGTKHCEFSARSRITGEKYWIEAKARSVSGVLGKTKADSAKRSDPTLQMTKHINEALLKPAPDRRMIFVDINSPPGFGEAEPPWFYQAIRRLEGKEQNLKRHEEAYVFITNLSFHHALDKLGVQGAALAYGLGMSDFGKRGKIRLSDWYRSKRKHSDAFSIMEALRKYPQVPETFDGRPSSEVFGSNPSERLLIGQTYFFKDSGDNGVVGTVESVVVEDKNQTAIVLIRTTSGSSILMRSILSEAELADYRKYGTSYFGESEAKNTKSTDIFGFYESLVRIHTGMTRNQLLATFSGHPEINRLATLTHDDLVLEVCECVASIAQNSAGAQ